MKVKNLLNWRSLFILISLIVLSLMMINVKNTGPCGDDVLYGTHGYFGLKYYLEGDTSCLNYTDVTYRYMQGFPDMKYGGIYFDVIPALIVRVFDADQHEFLIRRLCMAFIGILLIITTGLIARRLKNWKLASLALLLMACTPSIVGLSYVGGMDIATAFGFSVAILGMLIFTEYLPKISWKGSLLIFFGIAFATGVRIAGLMLLAYFFVAVCLEFIFRKDLQNLFREKKFGKISIILFYCLALGLLAGLVGLCACPNIFNNGIVSHIQETFNLVSKFYVKIPFIFEGQMAASNDPPPYYLVKSFFILLPPVILLGAGLFVLMFIRIFKKYPKQKLFFLLFAAIFPPVYITLSGANIYNGFRHLLFFYAPAVVLISMGWYEFFSYIKSIVKSKWFDYIAVLIILLLCFPTVRWMFKNKSYIYSYYNFTVQKPYLNYELEFYESSASRAYDWLYENHLKYADTIVTVSTKMFTPIFQAEKHADTTKIKVFKTSYMGFAETDCDYSIVNYHIIHPKFIKKFFPPKGSIHVEYVDGAPVCAVVKRNKWDSQGIQFVRQGKITEGMTLLKQSYEFDPYNFGIWFWLGYGYYRTGDYERALEFLNKYEKLNPNNEQAHRLLGYTFYAKKEYDQALKSFNIAFQQKRSDLEVAHMMALCMYEKKDYQAAIKFLQPIVNENPTFAQGKNLLEHILRLAPN